MCVEFQISFIAAPPAAGSHCIQAPEAEDIDVKNTSMACHVSARQNHRPAAQQLTLALILNKTGNLVLPV